MIQQFLIFLSFYFLVPTDSTPHVVQWGIQQSTGKSPFDPPEYDVSSPNIAVGIDSSGANKWPNGIIPYEFNYTQSMANVGGNTALCKHQLH